MEVNKKSHELWLYDEAKVKCTEPYTGFVEVRANERMFLSPCFIGRIMDGVCHEIEGKIRQWRFLNEFGGILVAYNNVQLLQKSADIHDDCGYLMFNVMVDYVVFKPRIGGKLLGVVNKTSPSHVGCLVHDWFNASLAKPVGIGGWVGDCLDIGMELVFRVVGLHSVDGVLLINGEIKNKDVKHFRNANAESFVDRSLHDTQSPDNTEQSSVARKKIKKRRMKHKNMDKSTSQSEGGGSCFAVGAVSTDHCTEEGPGAVQGESVGPGIRVEKSNEEGDTEQNSVTRMKTKKRQSKRKDMDKSINSKSEDGGSCQLGGAASTDHCIEDGPGFDHSESVEQRAKVKKSKEKRDTGTSAINSTNRDGEEESGRSKHKSKVEKIRKEDEKKSNNGNEINNSSSMKRNFKAGYTLNGEDTNETVDSGVTKDNGKTKKSKDIAKEAKSIEEQSERTKVKHRKNKNDTNNNTRTVSTGNDLVDEKEHEKSSKVKHLKADSTMRDANANTNAKSNAMCTCEETQDSATLKRKLSPVKDKKKKRKKNE